MNSDLTTFTCLLNYAAGYNFFRLEDHVRMLKGFIKYNHEDLTPEQIEKVERVIKRCEKDLEAKDD